MFMLLNVSHLCYLTRETKGHISQRGSFSIHSVPRGSECHTGSIEVIYAKTVSVGVRRR